MNDLNDSNDQSEHNRDAERVRTQDTQPSPSQLTPIRQDVAHLRRVALAREWTGLGGCKPLQQLRFRSAAEGRASQLPARAYGWIDSGAANGAFNFSLAMRGLCQDIVERCAHFHFVDLSRVLIGTTAARRGRTHGLQARVTPMRFADGRLFRQRKGRREQIQRFYVNGVEMMYLMTFCLPRFLDQTFDQKFVTIFHELYHIAPEFNGDLRRHAGRCRHHTHSQRGYDRRMAAMARGYLDLKPPPELYAFLRLDFAQLLERHGEIFGTRLPAPRLIPVA